MSELDTPAATRVDDSRGRRAGAGLLALAVAVVLLLHTRAFFVEHREADEVVYLTPARDMGWDLSNDTTWDDPVVREFPFELYRLPLFLHPPLFPLVLELGRTLGRAVDVGLTFELLAVALAMPFAHLALTAGLVPDAEWLGDVGVRALFVVSTLFTLATTTLAVLGNPFEVVPAALHFLPFLRPLLG